MYNELNIGQQALVFLFFAGAFAFVYMLLAIGFRKLQELIKARRKRSILSQLNAIQARNEENKIAFAEAEIKLDEFQKAGRNSISC